MNPQPAHDLRPRLILAALALAAVIVPYLTWHQTWFGRRLSQAEVAQYLADEQHPRKTQHALTFLAEQMAKADPAARAWYPKIVQAAHRPSVEIRTLAAWTMGQDNQSDILHQALLSLLDDPDVLVRRNAALSLVRFGDARGRRELVAMLRPVTQRVQADRDEVWEALRALYLIGEAEDLPAVDVYATGAAGASDRIHQQAVETARAIRKRMAPSPTR
jgi:HEAT repeat protein